MNSKIFIYVTCNNISGNKFNVPSKKVMLEKELEEVTNIVYENKDIKIWTQMICAC